EYVDLGPSAGCYRPHRGDSRDQADSLLDRPGYLQHLHIHRCDAVVDQNHDTRKIGLRKDRNRKLKQEDRSGQGKTEHDEDQRPAVGFHEIGDAAGHFASSMGFTSVPSCSPYPPSATSVSPALRPFTICTFPAAASPPSISRLWAICFSS